jgi:hypothetical protein
MYQAQAKHFTLSDGWSPYLVINIHKLDFLDVNIGVVKDPRD